MDNRQKHQKVCVFIQKCSSLVGALGYDENQTSVLQSSDFGVIMIINNIMGY